MKKLWYRLTACIMAIIVVMATLPENAFATNQAPNVTIEKSDGFGMDYLIFKFHSKDYVNGITKISVNGSEWTNQKFKIGLNGCQYYKDTNEQQLYFVSVSQTPLKSGDIMTIKNPSYEDLNLKITIVNQTLTITPTNQTEKPEDDYALHVRLVGKFESAIVGQEGYDVISCASVSVTQNKNSDCSVEAALLPKNQEPAESDWKLLSESGIVLDTKKTHINLDEQSGMEGIYSIYDSSITLSGTPKHAGTYPISVTITDKQGRTATSNSLNFQIYDNSNTLHDLLKYENCTQTQDGKYMYDMEPWKIQAFGRTETVTVPKNIKAWYGSHSRGTYGVLGYAVLEGSPQTQTLIIPKGCNLTFVNMDILSSVKIIVENGGQISLRDSTIHGVIEVKDGATFSMNYNDYDKSYLNGASINGQILLQDGATITNSKIYSNTNFIANGSQARHNTAPVMVVNGNVTLKGNVYLRGDEAPTGTDPLTGISYTGQTGLQINGTLHLSEHSVLAVYGGGKDATTSNGGNAILLNDGEITGKGKLIAIGGNGSFGNGGDAIKGKGTISTNDAYIRGGDSYFPKKTATIGKSLSNDIDILLSGQTNRNLIDGKKIKNNNESEASTVYWRDITTEPDLSLYPVEKNAPDNHNLSSDYEIISSWGNSVLVKMTVTNKSDEVIKGWSLSFHYSGTIISLWNADFEVQNGNQVKITAPTWNPDLAPASSVDFYFIATLS